MKKTSCKVTRATTLLINELLKHMDIPRTTFHRRAFDYFIESKGEVHPYLKIKDRMDPNYVYKDAVEQIYIEEEREAKIAEIAHENRCNITVVYFQALMTYCSVMAPLVLGEDEMNKMFKQKEA